MTGEFGRELTEAPGANWIVNGLAKLGFTPEITSVNHGGHVHNSEHFVGKAVDVGTVNGVPIGHNEATFNFLTAVIAAGGPRNIGTFGAFANNPALQAWAHQHGVNLFQDEGTGNHVHLGV